MKKKNWLFLSAAAAGILSCNRQQQHVTPIADLQEEIAVEAKKLDPKLTNPHNRVWNAYFDSLGLVRVNGRDSALRVRLKYATPDNFTGRVLYPDMRDAWLRPEAAEKLLRAQQLLTELRPGWHLLVYDAVRPFRIQRKMWEVARQSDMRYYVANPAKGGGLHNYGMAVDVMLTDAAGEPVPMGTPYDYPGTESYTSREDSLLAAGKISREAYDNRRLLRRVMTEAGFRPITREWWHFNACTLKEAQKNYPRIE